MTVEQRVASANIVIAGESEHVRIAVGVAAVGPAGQVAVAVIAPGVSTHGLVAAVHNGHLGVTVTAAAAGQVDDAGNFVLAVVFPAAAPAPALGRKEDTHSSRFGPSRYSVVKAGSYSLLRA